MMRVYITLWTELIYGIWINKCNIVYMSRSSPIEVVAKSVIFSAAARLLDVDKCYCLIISEILSIG